MKNPTHKATALRFARQATDGELVIAAVDVARVFEYDPLDKDARAALEIYQEEMKHRRERPKKIAKKGSRSKKFVYLDVFS